MINMGFLQHNYINSPYKKKMIKYIQKWIEKDIIIIIIYQFLICDFTGKFYSIKKKFSFKTIGYTEEFSLPFTIMLATKLNFTFFFTYMKNSYWYEFFLRLNLYWKKKKTTIKSDHIFKIKTKNSLLKICSLKHCQYLRVRRVLK